MRAVTWSPAGDWIAAHGTELYVWNLAEPGSPRTLLESRRGQNSAWSPDGKMFATEKFDEFQGPATIQIWDGPVKHLIREFRSGEHWQYSVVPKPRFGRPSLSTDLKWSPDGRILAATSGSSIRLWDPASGQQPPATIHEQDLIGCLAWAPDGGVLASGSNDTKIRLWDPKTRERRGTLEGHTDLVTALSFSRDGRFIASQSYLNTSILWELDRSGTFKRVAELPTGQVGRKYLGPLFNPKYPVMATFAEENTAVQIWRIADARAERGDVLSASDITHFVPVDEVDSAADEVEREGGFDPDDREDARHRTFRSIAQRRGQRQFRDALIHQYEARCAITGGDAVDALEAAHISPYRNEQANHATNGLLLRADIHTLFDLHLISVDPETNTVAVARQLLDTCYAELAGKQLKMPRSDHARPDVQALSQHYQEFLSGNARRA
jgi:hypothetical protein